MKRIGGIEHILKSHAFLQDLDRSTYDLLAGCATNVRFSAGAYIAREGDPADHFYLIREGTVAIELFVPGRGQVTVQTLGEGEMLGTSWLIPPYRWTFDARSVTRARAIAFDGKCLREKCEEDHDLGYEMMKRFVPALADRLMTARLQMADVYGKEPA